MLDNDAGQFSHGVVFALSEARINTRLESAEDLEVLVLVVDVSVTPGTTTLDLANGTSPGRLNVMTDGVGNSVSPAPTLVDGTINIIDLAPRLDTYLENNGGSGTVFTIIGSNFDQPELTVKVCGNDAEHEVLANGQTLRVTAPRCPDKGPALVEVCTVRGCVRDPLGFMYTVADTAPIVTSVISNSGRAGTIFFADARNLSNPDAVTVKVCGNDATFSILPGGVTLRTLQITAPDCGTGGWATLEVCNEFGCDTLTEGFDYDIVGGRQVPGDCNSDGRLDLSDGVGLLSHLFVGPPSCPVRARARSPSMTSTGTTTSISPMESVSWSIFSRAARPMPRGPSARCWWAVITSAIEEASPGTASRAGPGSYFLQREVIIHLRWA